MAQTKRNGINPVPGGGTIVGLHFHEDQLYAIRDMLQIDIGVAAAEGFTPGMYVHNAAGQVGEVVDVDEVEGTVYIAAVDASGFHTSIGADIHVALNIRFADGSGQFDKGDSVLGGTSGWSGEVGRVEVRDGALSSGDAFGVAVFLNGAGAGPTLGEAIDNTTGTGSLVMESVVFAAVPNAATVVGIAEKSDLATFWRSSDSGWEAADIGSVLDFTGGVSDPTASAPIPFTDTYFPHAVSQGGGSTGWTGDVDAIMVQDGTSISNGVSGGIIPGQVGHSNYIRASDFRVSMLESDVLTGVQFRFHSRDAGTYPGNWSGRVIQAPSNYNISVPMNTQGTLEDVDLPSAANRLGWGVTVTPGLIQDPSFGMYFTAMSYGSYSSPVLDSVELVVHGERAPNLKLYLWDGVEDLGHITVRTAIVTSGAWGTSDAAGYFRLTDWSRVEIPVGTELRTHENGAGSLIAKTDGYVRKPNLPGSKKLDEAKAKYQMISHNFFASSDTHAIYGVSGAGPAFWYDGQYLDFIYTGVDVAKDTPRHLSDHQMRLCLGYEWGEVYVSDANSPLTFDGSHFAASYGFGDKITGLEPASGDALAVFTESATHVLIGNNGADTPVKQEVINHKVGAIEYSVKNMGNRPIFTTFRGIETLETMDQYSNFFTAPLTYDVSPWLLPRLQEPGGVTNRTTGFVNAVVVSNKNQYRLFFADGWLLTVTYVGKERDPQCTTQKYWFTGQDDFARCYATASGVDSDGRDRAFFSVERQPDWDPDTGFGGDIDYAYEIDRGVSFDGFAIEASFLLTHYFSFDEQGPVTAQTKGFDSVQLHGYAAGYAGLHLSRAVNYEGLDDPVMGYEPLPMGSLSEPPSKVLTEKYTKGRLNARGFAVSMHIAHTSDVEFPHILQMITFTDDTPLRTNR